MKIPKDVFAERGRALEEEFFHRRDQELIRRLREKAQTEKGRDQLAQVTGITNQDLLNELLDIGIRAETVVCLTLVPLVQVAWADQLIDRCERQAVLQAAQAVGLRRDTASYQLLSDWLEHKPAASLFAAWRHYVAALSKILDATRLQQLRDDVVGRARGVAKAAGGFLGFGSVSDREKAVIEEIERVFAALPKAFEAALQACSQTEACNVHDTNRNED